MTDHDTLDPIAPEPALELYLDHKRTSCADGTIQTHRYRLSQFVDWCDRQGIDELSQLSGRHLQEYRLWKGDDGSVAPTTLNQNLCTIRAFLKWAASIEAVPEDLFDKLLIPRVPREQQRRDETLDSEAASAIIEFLTRYHFASQDHVAFALLWETGLRIGSAVAIDVDDVDLSNNALEIAHRPETDTPLKNGASGERLVAITPELSALIEEYIYATRNRISDDHGREPLITTSQGRMHRSTLRNLIYRVTAPCFRNEPCPDCTGTAERKCGESVSPHAIRRGSITNFLANDVPEEIVGDRMDVSRDVLDKHYDKRSEEVKLEQRRSYLDNI